MYGMRSFNEKFRLNEKQYYNTIYCVSFLPSYFSLNERILSSIPVLISHSTTKVHQPFLSTTQYIQKGRLCHHLLHYHVKRARYESNGDYHWQPYILWDNMICACSTDHRVHTPNTVQNRLVDDCHVSCSPKYQFHMGWHQELRFFGFVRKLMK